MPMRGGNFMLDLQLLSFAPIPSSSPSSEAPPPEAPALPATSQQYSVSDSVTSLFPLGTQEVILHRTRRPAILSYRSPLVDTAKTLVGLGFARDGVDDGERNHRDQDIRRRRVCERVEKCSERSTSSSRNAG